MSNHWEAVAEKTDGIYTVDQFESAAYRLVSEQVLYASDLRSRVAYGLVEQYEREFKPVLAPLGIRLLVNRQLRYACALPTHAKLSIATKEQTLLALVLRKIYDESARAGDINDDGEVVCDLVDLDEKYRLATHLDMPAGGRLDEAMRTLKRWGIARMARDSEGIDAEGTDQPFVMVIRPAIADVLGEGALQRLAVFADPQLQHGSGASDEDHDNDNAEDLAS